MLIHWIRAGKTYFHTVNASLIYEFAKNKITSWNKIDVPTE